MAVPDLTTNSMLRNHQEPLSNMSMSDIEEEGTKSPTRQQVTPVPIYVEAAQGTVMITLHLFREDKTNDYFVSFEEIAKVAFKRLQLPRGSLISADNTPYRKLTLR